MSTGIRNGWRLNHWLMKSDLDGLTYWDDELVQRYDGVWMKRSGSEEEIPRHPQEFVRALRDPEALKHIRPDVLSSAVEQTVGLIYANGPTLITRSGSPAIHLFAVAAGSGLGVIVKDSGIVENPFIVDND